MKKTQKDIIINLIKTRKQFLKFLILLLSFLGAAGSSYAQKGGKSLIDSLLQELPKQKEDTNKVNLLNGLSTKYYTMNPDEGIKYGQQALELATKLEWKKGLALANNRIGNNYYSKSDYSKALGYFEKSLKISEEIRDKNAIAGVMGNIGNVYHSQSDNTNALEYYLKAIKMYEEIGDKAGLAKVTGNTGNVYNSQSDYPKALEYYFKALKMDEEIGSKNGIANVTLNIGNVYNSQSDYPKALEYYFKALKMDEETGNKYGIANVYGNIGNVYNSQNNYPKALEYYFKDLKIDEEIGDKNAIALVTGNIGAAYTNQKNYRMAIAYAQNALKMDDEMGDKHNAAYQLEFMGYAYLRMVTDTPAKKGVATNNGEMAEGKYQPDPGIPAGKSARLHLAIDYLERGLAISKEIKASDVMQDCYGNLAKAYSLIGDYKKAMESTNDFHSIKDSVFSAENDKKSMRMGMKYEYDRQRFADSLRTDVDKKAVTQKLQRQRRYTVLGIAGILILASFSFFIVKERGKSEKLLLNILPAEVASELKSKGVSDAKYFDNVTVLFTDFINFTKAGERMTPKELVSELHTCFKAFDEITGKYGIEKIKTIGDAYLAIAGLPAPDPRHAENMVRAALEINAFMTDRVEKLGNSTFAVRLGIHSGSVVAGIVGVKKFAYDIWGDTVNTAARMDQNSEAGKINVSQTTYELVKDKVTCEYRGEINAKGKGQLKMYFIS